MGVGFRVLDDMVVIEPDAPMTVTPGGVVLPDNKDSFMGKTEKGVVLVVGPGRLNKKTGDRLPMSVGIGDRVVLSKYARKEIEVDGRVLYVLSEANVLATIPA